MTYLFKVTIAWAIFLLLFETLYKNNGRFTANRFYLLLSLVLGMLLPFIPLPSGAPAAITTVTSGFHPAAATASLPESIRTVAATAPQTGHSYPGLPLILSIIYGTGVLALLTGCIIELCKILLLMRTRPVQLLHGHKVIATGKDHSPYSFMGYIFISGTAEGTAKELEYIIAHEAAHNAGKHWIDLFLIQMTCILFWFHPLVWRYRHLLQLQHEYEADQTASANDPYTYGHFLLQQTLLNGVPSIAHSFHFSPIKNRIHMLTRPQHLKSGSWKYLLLLLVLPASTFLMAKSPAAADRTRQGNSMIYGGNTFAWRTTDTLYYDKNKKVAVPVAANQNKKEIIYVLNTQPVYQNEYLKTPATFGSSETAYEEYLQNEFIKCCANTPDSQARVSIANLVVSKEGKVVYHEVRYYRPMASKQSFWKPFPTREPALDRIVDRIIAESPEWHPAVANGQPVNSFVSFIRGGAGC